MSAIFGKLLTKNRQFQMLNFWTLHPIFTNQLWIHKGGCAISVQHYLRMAPFHCSYMEKWHKSFIFPKLKMISVQNVEDNTTVLCTFCWTSIMMADTLFSDQIMAMWAIMDVSVKIKSGSETFWTVKQMANITSNMRKAYVDITKFPNFYFYSLKY
jgi:hypothetical protein